MKILIMNNYYYPNMMGGAEHSIKLLAEQLARTGNEVHILSMDGAEKADAVQAEEINGVFVHRSYCKSIYRRRILNDKGYMTDKLLNGWYSVHNGKMNRDVKRVVDIVAPNVIHTQNLVSMSYWVWKYAGKKNIPVVHTLRDYWLLDPTTNIGTSSIFLTIPFRKYFKALSNKYVDSVTSPSERTLEIFKNKGYFRNSNGQVIVNAISYDEKLLKLCLEEKSKRMSGTVRFLFVGNVTENKGIRLLVNAFVECKADITLTVCGDGDLLSWVKRKGDSRIVCCGKLKPERLAEEYRKADVLVVPSLWEEPFGRIVIEGAQYGLPVLGSNRGGIPEIIKKLEYGDIFEPEGAQVSGMLMKYANRAYLKQIYAVGPKHLKVYAINSQIQEFISLYSSLRRRRFE